MENNNNPVNTEPENNNTEPETVDISVTVTDNIGTPIEGVYVEITDTEINGTTGSAGGCTLSNVPIDLENSVTITATKEGYQNYSYDDIITGEFTRVDIILSEIEDENGDG